MSKEKRRKPLLKKIAIGAGIVAGVILLAVVVFYAWPLTDRQLQQANPRPMSYEEAVGYHENLAATEATLGLRQDCGSKLLTNGKRAQKAVVMLHGYVSCPNQFSGLARYFFEKGYNVYVPRMPDHGFTDSTPEDFTSYDLVTHVSKAMDVAAGLGEEVGVIGLSGGGVLATWLAEYRDDAERLLVLSPFYEPSAERLPKWQVKPFLILYGNEVFADRSADNNPNLHYRSLAQFVRIHFSYKERPLSPQLKSVASVVALGDREIDQDLARSVPENLASANSLPLLFYQPPAEWNLGHDIAQDQNNPDIGAYAKDLFPKYFELYEGRQP